jgi:hypothetical protein
MRALTLNCPCTDSNGVSFSLYNFYGIPDIILGSIAFLTFYQSNLIMRLTAFQKYGVVESMLRPGNGGLPAAITAG